MFEQTALTVSREIFEKFLAKLDAPGKPNDRLRLTMTMKAPRDID